MVRIREKHLAPHHTGHCSCVSETPKAICPLLPTGDRGDKDNLAAWWGGEKWCSEGNTHATTTFSSSLFLFRKFDSPTIAMKNSLECGTGFLSLACFPCKKNLRGYIGLALLLFQSLFPAPLLLNCPLNSGFQIFFHRKLNGERKKQQRIVIKH